MIPGQPSIALGIYEKALMGGDLSSYSGWTDFFHQVTRTDLAFVDLSVDESPERIARLDWEQPMRRMVRQAAQDTGVQIGGICLSAHRKIAPGSADPAIRAQAQAVMEEGLRLAHDLHVGVVQVAGYYCYYEEPHTDARRWYAEMLERSVPLAARLGVTMAIENVDGTDVTSLTRAMEFVREIDSPYLQLYPDIGNIAEQGLDLETELAAGRGHMVALHAKDVRRGEPRRVPMGEGIVNWDTAFRVLADQRWAGRLMIEMWNDDAPDSLERVAAARTFIASHLSQAGLSVV